MDENLNKKEMKNEVESKQKWESERGTDEGGGRERGERGKGGGRKGRRDENKRNEEQLNTLAITEPYYSVFSVPEVESELGIEQSRVGVVSGDHH